MTRELYSDEQELVDCLEDAITEIHEKSGYLLELTLKNIRRLADEVISAWEDEKETAAL